MKEKPLLVSFKRPSVGDHCKSRTLLIPEQLVNFSDARIFMRGGSSCIYYKNLENNLRQIEFFSSQLCFVYVISGSEDFASYDGEVHHISSGESLLLQPNTYMASDFVNNSGPLKSLLFFIEEEIIGEFLASTRSHKESNAPNKRLLKITQSLTIDRFITSLQRVYNPRPKESPILKLKLLELLHLVHENDATGLFWRHVSEAYPQDQKRNISKLMSEHFLRDLSIQDYAQLSGRSLSTFTREFRRIYNKSPSQWLMEARISYAYDLVLHTDLSITQISNKIGYGNVSHFIKIFREKYGQTPKQMRKNTATNDLSK